ncbi:PREDICTED: CD109 antigen-like [Galeopterus variegatus]|uniref:CD109 antigen-like n=1 Tax=Galeopterus variegatus TaxID=482537 RepID=A0ABM0SH92_GALVR|nr:PREDICTED: CD109 antigen-like [Galeopterus variegatus]
MSKETSQETPSRRVTDNLLSRFSLSPLFFHGSRAEGLAKPQFHLNQLTPQLEIICGSSHPLDWLPLVEEWFYLLILMGNVGGYQRELLYQREDGSFSAFGNDDPSGSTWLSAFVLRCFLEADPYIDIDQNVLHRTYTWLKGRQKSSGEFWEPGRVIHRDMQFWVSSVSKLSDSWQPRSLDIEVAAYALLSHFLQLQVSEGIPIMRWLSRQRNSLGGFASTQDTIVALKALSEFAALMNTERTHIQVTVIGPSSPQPVTFLIDTHNRLLLQTAELAVVKPTVVNISANGFGFAICQLNVIYNVKDSGFSRRRRSTQNQEAFDLDVAVKDDEADINHVNLNVCTRFLGPDRSGMALMEVNLLSGFTVSSDAIPLSETVKKVEHDHGKLNLYLDSVNETQFCVDIPAVRNFKVSNTQDASVSIVDYYEPRRHAVRSYNSKAKLFVCDLCRDIQGCGPCEAAASVSLHHSSVIFICCFMLLSSLQHWL